MNAISVTAAKKLIFVVAVSTTAAIVVTIAVALSLGVDFVLPTVIAATVAMQLAGWVYTPPENRHLRLWTLGTIVPIGVASLGPIGLTLAATYVAVNYAAMILFLVFLKIRAA